MNAPDMVQQAQAFAKLLEEGALKKMWMSL